MSRSTIRRLGIAVLAMGMAACLDTTAVLNANMSVVAGNEQTGVAGQELPDSITVFVVHRNGLPLEGITVRWSVETGGGTVSPATTLTDANGLASTSRTLGPTVGEQTTLVRVDGLGTIRIVHTATAP